MGRLLNRSGDLVPPAQMYEASGFEIRAIASFAVIRQTTCVTLGFPTPKPMTSASNELSRGVASTRS